MSASSSIPQSQKSIPLAQLDVCPRSHRAFASTEGLPLDWYDSLLNHKQVGSVLNADTVVFERLELWYLIAQGWVAVDDVDASSHSPRSVTPEWTLLERDAPTLAGWLSAPPANIEHLARFLVYLRLRRNGYVVRSGLKCGTDFVAYQGKQGKSHAEYAVVVQHREEALEWCDIAAKSRLCSTVNKGLIVVTAAGKATLIRRWKV